MTEMIAKNKPGSALCHFRVMMASTIGRQVLNMLKIITILILILLASCEPMGPLPGGQLSGTLEPFPMDWSSSGDVDILQIETRLNSPYSINIWAVDTGNSIYIASGSGPQTEWVDHLKEDPNLRLRIEDKIYELIAIKVTDMTELDEVHARYVEKYDYQSDVNPQDAWVYRLDTR